MFKMHFWNIGCRGTGIGGGLEGRHGYGKCDISLFLPSIGALVIVLAQRDSGGLWGFIPAVLKRRRPNITKIRNTVYSMMELWATSIVACMTNIRKPPNGKLNMSKHVVKMVSCSFCRSCIL